MDTFCAKYNITLVEQMALIKLRMDPGDVEFNLLPREEWQGFGGLSQIAYRELVMKNSMYMVELAVAAGR
jgi:hypothetical protein